VKHRDLRAEEIRRVVVRGTNWVGDAVMTIPALRDLRRVLPAAHITLATPSWTEAIFAGADYLDDLLIHDRHGSKLPNFARQVATWRKQRFDLAVLFQNAFEAAVISTAARVPWRLGYPTDGRRFLLTHAVELPEWRAQRHEVYYYLNLVTELESCISGRNNKTPQSTSIDLKVSEQRQIEARELLVKSGADLSRAVIAICPGSTNSRAKRWPVERYAELADRFIKELNATIVLIGSSDEIAVSNEVLRAMTETPMMLTGRTTLSEAVAVLSVVDMLVSNDTGPAHIAGALGRPVIVIFGPTDPTTTRPFTDFAEIVRHPPDCAPCMLRDCPIDHRCMTAITPSEVFEKGVRLLTNTSTRKSEEFV
jgi:heptosyltransferase-2